MPSVSRHGRERQVRLKPEHADLYPGVLPGEWVPGWALAERLLALAEEAGVRLYERVWDPRHFDFSGGTGPPPELRALRTCRFRGLSLRPRVLGASGPAGLRRLGLA